MVPSIILCYDIVVTYYFICISSLCFIRVLNLFIEYSSYLSCGILISCFLFYARRDHLSLMSRRSHSILVYYWQACAWAARPDKPSLAQKSQAWAAFFGPMGRPGQQKHDPTADSGRAWVANSDDFGKAWPDRKQLTRAGPGQTFSGLTVGPGQAWAAIFCFGLCLGPAREDAQV
jgi:hypothetical protein